MKNYKTYCLLRSITKGFLLLIFINSFLSCSKKNYFSNTQYQFISIDNKPDYGNLDYWAAHPWKKNPSDSVPKPLRSTNNTYPDVDVFFLHPTTLTNKNDERWNATIDDVEINRKTDKSTILYQASVFNETCRVFSPRYRQAHIKCFYLPQEVAVKYFDTAYEDIRNAFLFYLNNLNNDRPIIIASHSQGTKHAARLLKEFFEDKTLKNKLVCAYLIGLAVPDNYFNSLKPCKDSSSTGCFVSWRTYKRGYTEPDFVAKESFNAIVINPLTWTSDTTFIPSSKNNGGVLFKFNKIIPHVVNANINHNILWTSKPNFFGKIFFTKKNYHVGDINLFYINIRQNVKTRIMAFVKE